VSEITSLEEDQRQKGRKVNKDTNMVEKRGLQHGLHKVVDSDLDYYW
jgi:hypothetical protein